MNRLSLLITLLFLSGCKSVEIEPEQNIFPEGTVRLKSVGRDGETVGYADFPTSTNQKLLKENLCKPPIAKRLIAYDKDGEAIGNILCY